MRIRTKKTMGLVLIFKTAGEKTRARMKMG
jgi:hypothetical protein